MYHIKLKAANKYYGSNHVLKDIDLTVSAGSFTVIVGRSGCGKSTLLRVIGQLEDMSRGELYFSHADQVDKQPRIRMMFQDDRLLPWKSVLKNVAIGATQFDLAKKALSRVGLADKGNDWPEQLSGGQKQRVSLARALASQPDILLFDEPLGALDALTRMEMQNLIESLWLNQQFTSLLVTHDVTEAVRLADRVIVIDNGQVTLDQVIDLPRPRQRNKAFLDYEETLLNQIMGGI